MRDKMNKRYIYALVHPFTRKIFYIGQTSNLSRRFAEHCIDFSNSAKALLIQEIVKHNALPEMIILQEVTEEKATYFEEVWINLLLELETELTNTAIPSTSFVKPVEEKLLSKYSIEMNYYDICNVFYFQMFNIEAAYSFGHKQFIIFKNDLRGSIDVVNYLPIVQFEKIEQLFAKLTIEARSKQEKELIKYIRKAINTSMSSRIGIKFQQIIDVKDEHIEIISNELSKNYVVFYDVIHSVFISYNLIELSIDVAFNFFVQFSELFGLFSEYQLKNNFLTYLKEHCVVKDEFFSMV